MNNKSIQARFVLQYDSAGTEPFTLDVDLDIPGQGITGIFGQSGSGKTTLLRCIAGLHRAAEGKLSVNGNSWQDSHHFLPVHKRPLGYVFQETSLFPHLTAESNLNFALKRSRHSSATMAYEQAISLLGISHLLQRYPHQLSGGECQRVAIARAILIGPEVLLMDEPLASLDQSLKQEILPYLERLRAELDIPILYVSHSADEVTRLADHLVVLHQGKVLANGALGSVLSHLDLPIQMEEDAGSILQATVIAREEKWHLIQVAFPGGDLWVSDRGEAVGDNIRIRISAKDVSIALAPHRDTSILNLLAGQIVEIAPESVESMCLIRIEIGKSMLVSRITRHSASKLNLQIGQSIWAQIKSVAIIR